MTDHKSNQILNCHVRCNFFTFQNLNETVSKKIETPKTDEVIKEVVKKELKKDLIKKKSTSIISKIKKLASKKSK